MARQTVTPYFTVADADKLVGFLTQVFDGVEIRCNRHPDGKVQHARVRVGTSTLMLNEQTPDYPANRSQMHVLVDDVDAVYESAKRAGAVGIMEPQVRPHGERMAGIEDPCGNLWWIAQPAVLDAAEQP